MSANLPRPIVSRRSLRSGISREAAVGHPRSAVSGQNKRDLEQARSTVAQDRFTDQQESTMVVWNEARTGPLYPYDRQ